MLIKPLKKLAVVAARVPIMMGALAVATLIPYAAVDATTTPLTYNLINEPSKVVAMCCHLPGIITPVADIAATPPNCA